MIDNDIILPFADCKTNPCFVVFQFCKNKTVDSNS